jgi:Kef-type K+ transport system membrane component KefB
VPMRESVALGALMNARGLIELILLNIGLQAKIITPTLFTILVLVAIITTLMASPIFDYVYGRHRSTTDLPTAPEDQDPSPEVALVSTRENRASDIDAVET